LSAAPTLPLGPVKEEAQERRRQKKTADESKTLSEEEG